MTEIHSRTHVPNQLGSLFLKYTSRQSTRVTSPVLANLRVIRLGSLKCRRLSVTFAHFPRISLVKNVRFSTSRSKPQTIMRREGLQAALLISSNPTPPHCCVHNDHLSIITPPRLFPPGSRSCSASAACAPPARRSVRPSALALGVNRNPFTAAPLPQHY